MIRRRGSKLRITKNKTKISESELAFSNTFVRGKPYCSCVNGNNCDLEFWSNEGANWIDSAPKAIFINLEIYNQLQILLKLIDPQVYPSAYYRAISEVEWFRFNFLSGIWKTHKHRDKKIEACPEPKYFKRGLSWPFDGGEYCQSKLHPQMVFYTTESAMRVTILKNSHVCLFPGELF